VEVFSTLFRIAYPLQFVKLHLVTFITPFLSIRKRPSQPPGPARPAVHLPDRCPWARFHRPCDRACGWLEARDQPPKDEGLLARLCPPTEKFHLLRLAPRLLAGGFLPCGTLSGRRLFAVEGALKNHKSRELVGTRCSSSSAWRVEQAWRSKLEWSCAVVSFDALPFPFPDRSFLDSCRGKIPE
jgi:hypothetical protein